MINGLSNVIRFCCGRLYLLFLGTSIITMFVCASTMALAGERPVTADKNVTRPPTASSASMPKKSGNAERIATKKTMALALVKYMLRTGAQCRRSTVIHYLHQGVDPNSRVDRVRLVSYALMAGAGECALALLQNGASTHFKVIVFRRPFLEQAVLYAADADTCDGRVMRYLIDHGADQDTFGKALSIASILKHVNCAKILLKSGANVEYRLKDDSPTPLMLTQRHGTELDQTKKRAALTTLLLRHGADPHAKAKIFRYYGKKLRAYSNATTLYFAVGPSKGVAPCASCARILLKSGAKANTFDSAGQTPLLWALQPVNNTNEETVKVLIKGGAKVNLANPRTGETALMAAAGNGNGDIVNLLLKAGAKKCEKDKKGRTASNYADGHHYRALASTLKCGDR